MLRRMIMIMRNYRIQMATLRHMYDLFELWLAYDQLKEGMKN